MPITNPGATTSALPLDLTDLPWVAAFEAKRLTPIGEGAALSTWTDFSGNARHATQTGSARPVYKTAANGINSQPVVRFTAATSQFMSTTTGGAALTGSFYMAAVVRFTSITGLQQILCFGDDLGGKRRAMLKYSSFNQVGWNGQSADITPGGPAPTAGVACFLEIIRSGTTISVYMNGVRTSSGSPSLNSYTSAALHLGTNNGLAGEFLDADLALALFLGSAPDAAQLARIRGYVAATYGITLSGSSYNFLPANASTSGLPARSSFFDNSTEAGLYGPRLVALTTSAGDGHLFANDDPTHGPVIFQNLNPSGYGAVDWYGEDVGTYNGSSLVAAYGCAAGWGNSAASPAVFRGVAYFEVYDSSASGSHRGFRLVQTAQGHNYRRLEVEAASGDTVFYRRDNDYPSETEILRLKNTGAVLFNNLPTSDPAAAGQLWNSAGTLRISAG